MTAPTDFSSFAYGFNLTSANYSGGAGGTFANLVSGGQNWTVASATPSFTTKSGTGWSMEGMDFSNSATELITGQQRALWETTVIVVAQITTSATVAMYGTSVTTATGSAVYANAYRLEAINNTINSGWTAALNNSRPNVYCCTWSPHEGKLYAQINDGSVVSTTQAAGSLQNAAWLYPDASIGGMRTTYMTGWIGRVLVFDRALHYRDNTNLQSLIATEMASIGL